MPGYSRREFNRLLAAGLTAVSAPSLLSAAVSKAPQVSPLDQLAFSSWCFHMPLWKGEMKAHDLPDIARSMDVDALEWTSKTLRDLRSGKELMYQAPPATFFHQLRTAADDAGINSKVLNVGGPFFLASPNRATQQKALDYVLQYVEPAQLLGCDILRTELYFDGEHKPGWEDEAHNHAVEGLQLLLQKTRDAGLVINIENHHGISSQPQWLAGVINSVNDSQLGLTVDTNNFRIDQDNPYAADEQALPRYMDRYLGMENLMPLANWVSAKFYAFDSTGYEISLNYPRIMDIILQSGYSGYLSVEYEGAGNPLDGVRNSIAMLKKMRAFY